MLTVKCLVFGLHVIAQQNHGEYISLCVSQILFIFTFSLTSFFFFFKLMAALGSNSWTQKLSDFFLSNNFVMICGVWAGHSYSA